MNQAEKIAQHPACAEMRILELEALLAQKWQPIETAPMQPDVNVVYEMETYLVTDGDSVEARSFSRGNGAGNPWAEWSIYGGIPKDRITHWMNLPNPPTE